jgi:cobyrinic acid a,c-diamide synthase
MSISLPPGLLIAAPRSGSGKTLLTLGLLRAFRNDGLLVQPFKCGPDYIDGAFHRAASGRDSHNLDCWAMSEALLARQVAHAEGADLILAEGLMGLFDGVTSKGASGHGSSAEIAARHGWPVILVADVSGQSRTVAASLAGFRLLTPHIRIGGVVLNRVGSPRHERLAREALAEVDLLVLGALPRQADIALPERHLGLVQAEETGDLDQRIEAMAAFVGQHVDLQALRQAAAETRFTPARPPNLDPPGQRIALARDAAFSFVYPHIIAGWRKAGAEILPFSPLNDEGPDDSADVCWLPGGYPELHAGILADNHRFQTQMRAFATTKPVHGECGGYMTLGSVLVDAKGDAHRMLGLLGLETSYQKRKLHLGYRKAVARAKSPAALQGQTLHGHEFHYASILTIGGDEPLFSVTDSEGQPVAETGSRRGLVSGSFFHRIDSA